MAGLKQRGRAALLSRDIGYELIVLGGTEVNASVGPSRENIRELVDAIPFDVE